MNVLIFGKGAIYESFYAPVFAKLKYRCFFFDPLLDFCDVASLPKIDLVLITSPAKAHFENFIFAVNNLDCTVYLIEKPLVTSIVDFYEITSIKPDAKIFTVTPFRLMRGYDLLSYFLTVHSGIFRSCDLEYGNRSVWPSNSQVLVYEDSAIMDFGPHLFDFILSSNNRDFTLDRRFAGFNSFESHLTDDLGRKFKICVSRDEALSNSMMIRTTLGRCFVPLGFESYEILYDEGLGEVLSDFYLERKVHSSLELFVDFINTYEPNNLFSSATDFARVLTLLEDHR